MSSEPSKNSLIKEIAPPLESTSTLDSTLKDKKNNDIHCALIILHAWYNNWPENIELHIIDGNKNFYIKVQLDPKIKVRDFIVNYTSSSILSSRTNTDATQEKFADITLVQNKSSAELDEIEKGENFFCIKNNLLSIDDIHPFRKENYKKILSFIQNRSSLSILEITSLNEKEKKYIHGIAHTPSNINKKRKIEEFLQFISKQFPDKIAVIHLESQITYKDLLYKICAFSSYLETVSRDNNKRIIVFLPRSIYFIISILSILNAGCSFIPIDPKTPTSRIKDIIADSAAQVIIVNNDTRYVSDHCNISHIINISEFSNKDIETNKSPLLKIHHKDNEAYIIYTSGSSGIPKGVIISRSSLSYYSQIAASTYDIKKEDNVLQFSSLSFDAMIEEVFPALIKGSTLILRDEHTLGNPALFFEKITAEKITILNLPTAYWREIINTPDLRNFVFKHLRVVIIGGERIYFHDLEKWKKVINEQKLSLFNTYGPTETTVVTTTWHVPLDNEQEYKTYKSPPIGTPIPGSYIYILDRYGRISPFGGIGELVIGGPGVSIGYTDQSNIKQKNFCLLSINNRYKGKYYKSGDLGLYAEDGKILFLNRVDDQIKINGFRVEIDELVNRLLNQFSDIEDLIVVPYKVFLSQDRSITKLACFIQPRSIQTFDVNIFREYIKETLPYYMQPNQIVVRSNFPKTINNKTDINLLKKMIKQESNSDSYPNENLTTADKLIELWKKILGDKDIRKESNFFHVGGTSLDSVRLYTLVNKTFDVKLPLNQLYRTPVLKDLSKMIDSVKEENLLQAKPVSHTLNFRSWRNEAVQKEINSSVAGDYFLHNNSSNHNYVLLTGATGFLGIHLLRDLIKQNCTVFCLINAKTMQEAALKLEHSWNQYHLPLQTDINNINIVLGDLGKDYFGLQQELYEKLSKQITVVVHSAANVNMMSSYEQLYNTNVAGTRRIVDFCQHKYQKKLHFISSMAIFDSDPKPNGIDTHSSLDLVNDLHGGYAQSKWVADKFLNKMIEKGVDAYIYRCGRIWGDTQTKVPPKNDFILRFIAGCVHTRCFPDIDMSLDVVPVNIISQILLKMIFSSIKDKRILHLVNHNVLSFKEIVEIIKKSNSFQTFEILDYRNWIKKVKEEIIAQENFKHKLAPIISILDSPDYRSWVDHYFPSEKTKNFLNKKLDVNYPIISNQMLISSIKKYSY